LRPSATCPTRRTELFLPGTIPQDTCDVHRLVRLDRRTGLLAGPETPEGDAVDELFTVYPPVFHPWMRDNGVPFPPEVTHRQALALSDSVYYSDRLQIQYPETGAVFQLDPVLRPTYQSLHLRGTAEPGLFDLQWWVDGAPIEADYREAYWQLTPGTHRIELRSVSAAGQRLRSRPSVIQVLGMPDSGS
jgi:penicillin-binding protein 1C